MRVDFKRTSEYWIADIPQVRTLKAKTMDDLWKLLAAVLAGREWE